MFLDDDDDATLLLRKSQISQKNKMETNEPTLRLVFLEIIVVNFSYYIIYPNLFCSKRNLAQIHIHIELLLSVCCCDSLLKGWPDHTPLDLAYTFVNLGIDSFMVFVHDNL